MVDLAWADLDPRTKPFDRDLLRVEIDAVIRSYASTFGQANAPRAEIVSALDRAIHRAAGTWACGWTWCASEPGGGGPTQGWCCERDSVFHADDPDAMTTATRAFEAVLDWRAFLDELVVAFAMLRAQTASLPVATEVERAAARLLAIVIDRTHAEDAWYNTLARTLIWYLEDAGMSDSVTERYVAQTIAGRFDSWMTPDDDAAQAVFADLGARVAERTTDAPRDSLADWRIVRAHPIAVPSADRLPTTTDAHEDYILLHDLARDSDRAERMTAALLVCRDSAARGMPLSFDQLAEWQRIVLGTPGPVPLRTGDAFAKQGRECYRYTPDLRDAFDHALAEASDLTLDVAVRAARAYLDVCFFHPFPDGNARSARLALDHALTSANLTLRVTEPIFSLSRAADDPDGLWHLAHVIEQSIATRASSR